MKFIYKCICVDSTLHIIKNIFLYIMKVAKKINENTKPRWIHPWNTTKFNNLYDRDERYFSVLVKGVLSWLNRHIYMYDKPINHFIFNTGSSYLYLEPSAIDYEYKIGEVTGESAMYSHMPRCIVELGNISIEPGDLSSGFAKGTYERLSYDPTLKTDVIKSYNSSIKRIPIEMDLSLKYVLSNFNESIILIQEYIDKLIFQKYFNIVYLGNVIQCSIEMPQGFQVGLNKIDMTVTDTIQKTIELELKIKSSYPCINERTEIGTDKVIAIFDNRIILTGDENDLPGSDDEEDPYEDIDEEGTNTNASGDEEDEGEGGGQGDEDDGDDEKNNSDPNGSDNDPKYNQPNAIVINTEYTHYLQIYPGAKLLKKGCELYIQITPNEYRYVGTTSLSDEEFEKLQIVDSNKYPNVVQDVEDYIIS